MWQDHTHSDSMDFDATEQQPRVAPAEPIDGSLGRRLLRQRMFPRESEVSHIGRYMVLRFIGAGGMGQVFAAYDPSLDRKVAIKLLAAHNGNVVEHRTRMLREAQAMAKLSHPNVVQVYEAGEHEGQVYVVMEFVEGQTLASWLESETRPSAHAIVDKFLQAGRGLVAAHRAGIVHRDFKPSNVIIDAQGIARVLDFGLAGSLGGDRREQPPVDVVQALDIELTTTGTMLGTPAYMAPEQFTGGVVDARADQFGFCVSLFEALAGNRPFASESLADLIENVTRGQRSPARMRGLSRRAARAIERGLSVSAEARWPSMDALLEAIAPRSKWRALGLASIALLPVIAFGTWWMVDDYEQELDERSSQIHTEQRARLELVRDGARAQNRRLLALAGEVYDHPQRAIELLREVDLDVSHDHTLWMHLSTHHIEDVIVPTQVISPADLPAEINAAQLGADGRLLVIIAANRGGLWRLDADTRTSRQIALDEDGKPWKAVALDPSRPTRVAIGGKGLLRIVEVENDGVEPVVELPAEDLSLARLEFAPDGRWLLGYTGLGLGESPRLWSTDGSGTVVPLAHPLHGEARHVVFSPDASRIAVSFHDNCTVAIQRLDALGDPPTLLSAPLDQFAHALAFAPDGEQLAVGYRTLDYPSAIRVWPLDATTESEPKLLEGHQAWVWEVAFSPDGRHLLSASYDRTARLWELVSGRSRVLDGLGPHVSVRFSPNGKQIVTTSDDGTQIQPIEGDAPPIMLHGGNPRFGPDSDILVLTTGKRALIYDLATPTPRPPLARRLDTGIVQVAKHGERAVIDPTGRWLTSGPLGSHIYVFDTRDWTVASLFRHLGDGDVHLAIASNGRVAAGGHDGKVWLWQPGRELGVEVGELGVPVLGCRLSPAGDRLLAYGERGISKIWQLDADAPSEGRQLLEHAAWVSTAAFGPDGRSFATAATNQIHLWREGDTAPLQLTGHASAIMSLEFDAGGTKLVSASKDGTARVWSVTDGRQLAVFDHQGGAINRARFDPRGESIVTASTDGTARIWSIAGGEPLSLTHAQSVEDASFASDGRMLVTGTLHGTAHRWQLDAVDGPVATELAGNGSRTRWSGVDMGATAIHRVAFVADGASVLVLTANSMWIWDVDYTIDQQLTWMWRSVPTCPTYGWRARNLGLDFEAARAATDRCEAMVECMFEHDYRECKAKLAAPDEGE